MTLGYSGLRNEVEQMCREFGVNSMLVQGAGGNASWKDDGVLWVKASGTWLSKACEEDIFVPVDMTSIDSSPSGDGSYDFRVVGESKGLRPSIETVLHGLMPQRVVVHLHAVDALVTLVQKNCKEILEAKLGHDLRWCVVGYHKPGVELATAVSNAIKLSGVPDVVFMQNHGIVIGGDSVSEIKDFLQRLRLYLRSEKKIRKLRNPLKSPVYSYDAYRLVDDLYAQQLALCPSLLSHVINNWAITPDHVVFLGPRAHVVDKLPSTLQKTNPDLVFVPGHGVFCGDAFNATKKAQLRCYFDVVSRIDESEDLLQLDDEHVAQLLNWDAEKIRQKMAER